MGTNYYLRNKVSEDNKKLLKQLIDADKNDAIKELVHTLYSYPGTYNQGEKGGFHLGKKSGGWRFLWNPNIWIKDDGFYDSAEHKWCSRPTLHRTYELSKEGITKFLTGMCDKGSIIVSEYYDENKPNEEVYTIEEFLKMAFDDQGGISSPSESYGPISKEWNDKFSPYGYNAESDYHSDFTRDGLRFATFTEFS